MGLRNTNTVALCAAAALTALLASSCATDSSAAAEPASSPDATSAAPELTDAAPASDTRTDTTDDEAGAGEATESAWAYHEEHGWYEYPVITDDQSDSEPAQPGPEIDAPAVEPCPYHEEVGAVDGSVSHQIAKALELGCEMGIHGEIDFEQPLDAPENSSGTYSLTSVEDALSLSEMCDQGYISEEECTAEDRWW